mmetsp:Transcript_27374/g.23021  ORF Transcript_27374/g.23021 Transcript_27374/m.23021 type:complete len:90 (+) Transcript_27374:236-505(+)
MTTIIPSNSTIPIWRSKTFTTYADQSVCINVWEGELQMNSDMKFNGEIKLGCIPAIDNVQPEITVKFDIYENGILCVEAICKEISKKNI